MCYKRPGPRCSSHAAATLVKAKYAAHNHTESSKPYEILRQELQVAQDDYDATPAGILELKRRTDERNHSPYEEYIDRLALGVLRRKEALASIGVKDKGDWGVHDERLEQTDVPAASHEFQGGDGLRSGFLRGSEKAARVSEALIKGFRAWMEKLTPEETEAVSWMTSDGFLQMRSQLDGRYPYGKGVEIDIDGAIGKVNDAMRKAPRLKKPVLLYRGIAAAHIVDDPNEDKYDGLRSMRSVTTEEVVNKYPVGSTVDMGAIPSSATLNRSSFL